MAAASPKIFQSQRPVPRSPGKVQFNRHCNDTRSSAHPSSEHDDADVLALSISSAPDIERCTPPHSPITIQELRPLNPSGGFGDSGLDGKIQSGDSSETGPQRTVVHMSAGGAEVGFPIQFQKFMLRHKLNGMCPADRDRSLSMSSELETRAMLMELVDICQSFVERSQSISTSDSHRSGLIGGGKSLNMSMSSFLHGVAPRQLHAVKSDFSLPAPAFTNRLEEGEDEAGFSTLNEYTILGEAGRGSYGCVHIATTPSGEYRAIKAVKKAILKKQWRNVRRRTLVDEACPEEHLCDSNSLFAAAINKELEIMKKVRHQNIVHLYEAIDDPDEGFLYLVMPFVERGPLVKLSTEGSCDPLDIDIARGYLRQIVDALRYLHERHIVHCDIKPDNLLLGSNGRVYLSDFGVSRMFDDGECSTTDRLLGTPSFMAPECFPAAAIQPTPHAPSKVNGKLVDVWALGVTLYTLLLGHLPFSGSSQAELIDAIQHREPDYIPLSAFSSDSRDDYAAAFDLVRRMLTKDPAARISVKRCARHPFLRRGSTTTDDSSCLTQESMSASVEQS